VFRYAIATGRGERDISADLRGALPPLRYTHHAAITEAKAVGALLRAIDGYHRVTLSPAVRYGLLLWCLSDQVNYGRRNGRNSTWITLNGVYRPRV
jgi:hypothetical protein